MPTVKCLHCNAENDPKATGGYCDECGKKLPSGLAFTVDLDHEPRSGSVGPSFVGSGLIPRQGLWPSAETAAVGKAAKRQTAGILFGLAVLQVVCCFGFLGLVAFFEKDAGSVDGVSVFLAAAEMFVVGLAFAGLGLWALYQPLPAATAGLILYVSLWALSILGDPSFATRGIIVRILVILALAKAIQAGQQYNKLKRADGN
jgi:hypothetical protein